MNAFAIVDGLIGFESMTVGMNLLVLISFGIVLR
jgi:hypothetical protein